MGNKTSRVIHKVSKPIRDYNIDERVHKAALKSPTVVAPKHPTTLSHIAKARANIPQDVKESLHASDSKLDERLKKVFVTSQDYNPEILRETPERPLPLNRYVNSVPTYGYHEPSAVTYGKVTLRNALTFISKHQEDKENNSSEKIAKQYKMDTIVVDNILKYFGTFRLVIPQSMSPREEELFKRLQATSSSFPATPEIRSLLGGIPISGQGKPDSIKFEKYREEASGEEFYKTRMSEELKALSLNDDIPPDVKGVSDPGMYDYIKDSWKKSNNEPNVEVESPPKGSSDAVKVAPKAAEPPLKGSLDAVEHPKDSSDEPTKRSDPYKFVSRNPRKEKPVTKDDSKTDVT